MQLGPHPCHLQVVTFAIDADSVRWVQRVAPGRITSATVPTFEAASLSGLLTVAIENTGDVRSLFTVTVTCTGQLQPLTAQQLTLEAPPATSSKGSATFAIRTESVQASAYACVVELQDGLYRVTDSKTVLFNTTATRQDAGQQGGSPAPGAPSTSTNSSDGSGSGSCSDCGSWNVMCAVSNRCYSVFGSWVGVLLGLAALALIAWKFPFLFALPFKILNACCSAACAGSGSGRRRSSSNCDEQRSRDRRYEPRSKAYRHDAESPARSTSNESRRRSPRSKRDTPQKHDSGDRHDHHDDIRRRRSRESDSVDSHSPRSPRFPAARGKESPRIDAPPQAANRCWPFDTGAAATPVKSPLGSDSPRLGVGVGDITATSQALAAGRQLPLAPERRVTWLMQSVEALMATLAMGTRAPNEATSGAGYRDDQRATRGDPRDAASDYNGPVSDGGSLNGSGKLAGSGAAAASGLSPRDRVRADLYRAYAQHTLPGLPLAHSLPVAPSSRVGQMRAAPTRRNAGSTSHDSASYGQGSDSRKHWAPSQAAAGHVARRGAYDVATASCSAAALQSGGVAAHLPASASGAHSGSSGSLESARSEVECGCHHRDVAGDPSRSQPARPRADHHDAVGWTRTGQHVHHHDSPCMHGNHDAHRHDAHHHEAPSSARRYSWTGPKQARASLTSARQRRLAAAAPSESSRSGPPEGSGGAPIRRQGTSTSGGPTASFAEPNPAHMAPKHPMRPYAVARDVAASRGPGSANRHAASEAESSAWPPWTRHDSDSRGHTSSAAAVARAAIMRHTRPAAHPSHHHDTGAYTQVAHPGQSDHDSVRHAEELSSDCDPLPLASDAASGHHFSGYHDDDDHYHYAASEAADGAHGAIHAVGDAWGEDGTGSGNEYHSAIADDRALAEHEDAAADENWLQGEDSTGVAAGAGAEEDAVDAAVDAAASAAGEWVWRADEAHAEGGEWVWTTVDLPGHDAASTVAEDEDAR